MKNSVELKTYQDENNNENLWLNNRELNVTLISDTIFKEHGLMEAEERYYISYNGAERFVIDKSEYFYITNRLNYAVFDSKVGGDIDLIFKMPPIEPNGNERYYAIDSVNKDLSINPIDKNLYVNGEKMYIGKRQTVTITLSLISEVAGLVIEDVIETLMSIPKSISGNITEFTEMVMTVKGFLPTDIFESVEGEICFIETLVKRKVELPSVEKIAKVSETFLVKQDEKLTHVLNTLVLRSMRGLDKRVTTYNVVFEGYLYVIYVREEDVGHSITIQWKGKVEENEKG